MHLGVWAYIYNALDTDMLTTSAANALADILPYTPKHDHLEKHR